MQQTYVPPGVPSSPRNKWPIWLWIVLGSCGCLVVLAGLGTIGYGIVRMVRKTMASGDAAGRPFLAAIDRGDDRAAYAMTTAEMREVQPYPDFQEYVHHWRNLEGGLGNLQCTWVGENSTPDGTFLNVRFHSTGSKRNADVQVNLQRDGDGWKVRGCNYTLQAR